MNKVIRKFLLGFFALVVSLSFVTSGYSLEFLDDFGEKTGLKDARERLTAGPVKLHPYVSQQMSYDSNVFLEPHDRKDDVIWLTTPGITVDVPFGDHLIEADYRCDFENFTKFTSQNDQNQYFNGLVDLSFPDWYFNAKEKLAQTSSRAGTTFTDRIGRFENTTQGTLGYKWNQFTMEADYHLFNRRFSSSTNDQYDYDTNMIGTTLFFELTKKTQVFVEYAHGFINYRNNNNRDGNFDRVRGGVRGKILPRMTAIAKLGWESRRYRGANEPSFDSLSAEVAVRQQFTDRTAVELGYTRGPEEATFLDISYYTQDSVFLRLEQKLFTNFKFISTLSYASQVYGEATTVGNDRAKRWDRILTSDISLTYNFREWWNFGVGYHFAYRDSKFNGFDYKDNMFFVRTGINL